MKSLINILYKGILTILAALMTSSVATASTPLVSANWLADNLDNPELVIIDLRNSIDGGGYETFLEGHIPGAIHSDYGKAGWRVSRDDCLLYTSPSPRDRQKSRMPASA